MNFRTLPLVATWLLGASGCIITVDRDEAPPPQTTTYAPQPAAPATPMVVVLDADKTMNVVGGDGVGVFVEYKTGGKWQISWTCDTNRTDQLCGFDFQVRASQITNAAVDGIFAVENKDTLVHRVVTSTQVGRMTFEVPEGEPITVRSTIDGENNDDGRYFFFVQDGNVNGGFNGRLSNPLTFKPR